MENRQESKITVFQKDYELLRLLSFLDNQSQAHILKRGLLKYAEYKVAEMVPNKVGIWPREWEIFLLLLKAMAETTGDFEYRYNPATRGIEARFKESDHWFRRYEFDAKNRILREVSIEGEENTKIMQGEPLKIQIKEGLKIEDLPKKPPDALYIGNNRLALPKPLWKHVIAEMVRFADGEKVLRNLLPITARGGKRPLVSKKADSFFTDQFDIPIDVNGLMVETKFNRLACCLNGLKVLRDCGITDPVFLSYKEKPSFPKKDTFQRNETHKKETGYSFPQNMSLSSNTLNITGQTLETPVPHNPDSHITKYKLIPVLKKHRHFYPGYKEPFILEAEGYGELSTYVTSAPEGTPKGDSLAGGYFQAGLRPWFKQNAWRLPGATLIITCLEPYRRYRLEIKKG